MLWLTPTQRGETPQKINLVAVPLRQKCFLSSLNVCFQLGLHALSISMRRVSDHGSEQGSRASFTVLRGGLGAVSHPPKLPGYWGQKDEDGAL